MATREDILAYVKKTFRTEPDYPWRRFPEYAVLRHEGNGKWYGLILNLPKARLGLEGEGNIDVINLKSDHVLDILVNSASGALPAYHMNKKHWITLVLDGDFPDGELYGLIDESHGLTQ
ncbi:MAG: MmcQ/YjbR family DNA-binding protein [Desulfovibrio sp.]|uniref:MmcQ/YjbR family DNA-binding protein n=1 Tax=Desulfovibrio sp. TaxID=885 RepID=UPI00258DB8A7|nr:MmcQ/YjbR family DNA-binding protein [Desulfovibrio sp.]MCD7983939.1 MmcQ/YjbR family DNA-binding protein [Desulfovibrio sp.]